MENEQQNQQNQINPTPPIVEQQPPTQQFTPPVQEDTKSSKKWLVMLVVILVLVIAGCVSAYFLWFKKSDETASVLNEPHGNIVNEENEESIVEIPTHVLSLKDIGVNFPYKEGNAAEDYFELFGVRNLYDYDEEGFFKEKYPGVSLDKVLLDSEDRNYLYDIASKSYISFYPDIYPLPDSMLELNTIKLVSFSPLRYISRGAIATAENLEKEGDYNEAEKLLQAVLKINTMTEESEFCTTIQWLAGAAVEKEAIQALHDLYERNNQAEKLKLMKEYQDEREANIAFFKEQVGADIYFNLSSLLFFTAAQVDKKGTLSIKSKSDIYALAAEGRKTDAVEVEKNTLETLNLLKNIDIPAIQLDSMQGLTFFFHADGFDPEQSLAEEILKKYTKSENKYVRQYAQKALDMSVEEILQIIGE